MSRNAGSTVAQYNPYVHEYPQGLWSGLLQMGKPQNDHVIYRVGHVTLSKQVVGVEVAMSHKASHPKLWVVYSADSLSHA